MDIFEGDKVQRAAQKAYLIFLSLIGLAGFLWLVPVLLFRPLQQSFTLILAFCLLGSMTRLLAFPVYRGRVTAFDSAFFVTAGLVLGWHVAALVIVVTMLVDLFWQRFRGRIFSGQNLQRAERFAQGLFSTFGNALLLLAVGRGLAALGLSPESSTRQLAVFVITPLALLAFVLLHYLVLLLAALLNGDRFWQALRRLFIFGVLGEILLTPIAMVMVLVYEEHDPGPFALLASTVLVVNFGFFMAARYAFLLKDQAAELSVMNQVSHALAHSLECTPLLQALADQLFAHFSATAKVLLCVREPASDEITGRIYELSSGAGQQVDISGSPLIRRLMNLKGPLQGHFDAKKDSVLAQLFARSELELLGTQLQVYEESIGAIVLLHESQQAYSVAEQQLLQRLASQVAFAVENARLFRLATVDGLTGLFVRRYFDQRLEEECRRSERYFGQFALLMMDLDDFKAVNDRFGHPMGDQVLRVTAAAIRKSLRAVDLAARYGGEEFVAVLPRTEMGEAIRVGDRIRQNVLQDCALLAGLDIQVSISVGVARYGEHGVDPQSLLQAADNALYAAKAQGKNKVLAALPKRPVTSDESLFAK